MPAPASAGVGHDREIWDVALKTEDPASAGTPSAENKSATPSQHSSRVSERKYSNSILKLMSEFRAFPIFAMGSLLLVFGISPLFLSVDLIITRLIVITGLSTVVVGVFLTVSEYLSQGSKDSLRSEIYGISETQTRLQLRNSGTHLKFRARNLSQTERQQVADKVFSAINADVLAKLSKNWEEKYSDNSAKDRSYTQIRDLSSRAIMRLREEIAALGKRANVNLSLGVAISFLGLVILAWVVLATASEISSATAIEEIAIRFCIRFSLALSTQIFAYFFLRLYRYSLFEIKYFQNEITSFESRVIAVEVMMISGKDATVEKLCMELIKTERNFILKKGETTIGLRKDEMEMDYDKQVTAVFEKLMERVSKGKS